MKRQLSLALLLVLQFSFSIRAQQPNSSPSPKPTATPQQPAATQGKPAPAGDEDVVRINTNLVQVDAVITDKNGKLVTDLRPEEVEIS